MDITKARYNLVQARRLVRETKQNIADTLKGIKRWRKCIEHDRKYLIGLRRLLKKAETHQDRCQTKYYYAHLHTPNFPHEKD